MSEAARKLTDEERERIRERIVTLADEIKNTFVLPLFQRSATGRDVQIVFAALGEVVAWLVAGWDKTDDRERALDGFYHGIRTAIDTIDAERKRGIH